MFADSLRAERLLCRRNRIDQNVNGTRVEGLLNARQLSLVAGLDGCYPRVMTSLVNVVRRVIRDPLQRRLLNGVIRAARASAKWTEVDGFEVASVAQRDSMNAPCVERVIKALHLVRDADPHRYRRMQRDVRQILCFPLGVGGTLAGRYNIDLGLCMLDPEYVLDEATSVMGVASTIVHEATHARLCRSGAGRSRRNWRRAERICVKAEIDFVSKFPDTEAYIAWAESRRAELSVEENVDDQRLRRSAMRGDLSGR